jgi:hypothetical protein
MNKEELIAKYIRNELNESDNNAIQELLDSDPDFKEQFEFEVNVQKAIYKSEYNKQKQLFKDIENKSNTENKTKPKLWYYIAASIIILVSVSIYWNQISKSPDRLFADYYKVASNTTYPIVRDNDSNSDITKAFVAYEREAYNEAQMAFANLYNTTKNTEMLFYEAICYLETDNTPLAIETFKKHQGFQDKLARKSQWYLALAYLKSNEKNKAENLLKEISSSTSNYNYDKAKDLLSKL